MGTLLQHGFILLVVSSTAHCGHASSTPPQELPTVTLEPKALSYAQVSAGFGDACAIVAGSGELACWGADNYGKLSAVPKGAYDWVDTGGAAACAIERDTHKLVCWGENEDWDIQKFAPTEGQFREVVVGEWRACAVRLESGHLYCWNGTQQTDNTGWAKGISFQTVWMNRDFTCGTRQGTGEIACNPYSEEWTATIPKGRFTRVNNFCGLRPNGSIECFPVSYKTSLPPQQLRLASFAKGSSFFPCGIREEDQQPICWNDDDNWLGGAPSETPMSSMSASWSLACGIAAKTGRVHCWGRDVGEYPELLSFKELP